MSDRYLVAGNPVAHSLSPQIHAEFARQTSQDVDYGRLLVAAGSFAESARQFFTTGGKGMNVTVPCKQEACEFAARLTHRATRAAAVNTLGIDADGEVWGDNTDGIGLLRDLRDNLNWPIAGTRILILGAGGATRGILAPLLAEQPECVVVANRTEDRARALVAHFAGTAGTVVLSACGFDALKEPFDLIIHATSAGLDNEAPALPMAVTHAGTAAYDLFYAASPTPFLRWAARRSVDRMADGIGMLVEQAAESFYLWRHCRPDTGPVMTGLRPVQESD